MAEENKDSTDNSRRNFIKTTALAAAGFMIVPRHVLGGKGFLAPSDRLMRCRYWCWWKRTKQPGEHL